MEKPMRNEDEAEAEAAKDCPIISGWQLKAEEYRILSDMTDFDNLRAMIEREATVNRRKKKRRRRKKKKKTNHESLCLHFPPQQQPAPVDAGKPAIDREEAAIDEAVRTVEVSKVDIIELSDDEEDEAPQNITADADIKVTETAQLVKSRIKGNGSDATCSREVIDLCSSSSEDNGFISNSISFRKSTREMVSREDTINEDGETSRRMELQTVVAKETVDAKKIKKQAENAKCAITLKSPETESTTNTVLQKLLRKPRYFDFPNGRWVSCLRCGEDHPSSTAANCRLQKRVKPCFLCGSLQHIGKNCIRQVKYCFACGGSGHQANGCAEKQQNNWTNNICLRCGGSGHDMFSCTSDYSPDNLKKIQCYICNDFGHLSCAILPDTSPTEISCYNCGRCGHLGSDCTINLPKFVRGSNATRLCYRCRQQGHFARSCTLSRKHARRIEAKTRRSLGSSSAPPDLSEPRNDAKNAGAETEERRIFDLNPYKLSLTAPPDLSEPRNDAKNAEAETEERRIIDLNPYKLSLTFSKGRQNVML